jgi:hypothetical protein
MHGHPLTGHTSDTAILTPKAGDAPSTPVAGR